MRHSFKAWGQQTDWPALRDIWIEADRDGFWDMVWLNDHLIPPKSEEHLPIFEAWALLAGAAATTERLRFGTMVSSNTFRHPGVLAKTIATIDHMSEGRLEIGLGAGWHEREHESYGIPLPALSERFDRLEETLAIVNGLLTQDTYSFAGRFHTLVEARCEPKPVQEPRPPFVVGGAGMKRTMAIAARWADQWNYPDYTGELEPLATRIPHLRELMTAAGRDPASIEISAQFRYGGDPVEARDRAEAYREIGVDHVLVSFTPPIDPTLPGIVAEALA